MGEERITLSDVEEYENFFTLIPPFLLERFAKKNKNLVLKFESKIESLLKDMDDNQKRKLNILLDSPVDELQSLMNEAYLHTDKKQYQILGNSKYKPFIESNLDEIRKMM